ncbi:hypothetical protein [Epilithonimonas sp. UC225_85]|uniref:hypothetical protein n=1 Tax=Epilithonimonas sp. UC225_85 TaxID=3350167 RepID=UPI0036D333AF
MEINKINYFEVIENTKSSDIIKYKNVRFEINKTADNSKFTLKSNNLIFFITIVLIVTINLFLGFFLTRNNSNGSFFILGGVVILYFIRKISLFLTEKIYSGQIIEFFQILKLYKERQVKEKI